MKRVRNGIRMGIALAALCSASSTTLAGQLNLVPLLQISGQYSDNVFFAPANQQSDTFFIINPGAALDYATPTFIVSLAYQAGFQRHIEFEERDNTVHRFDGTIGLNLRHGLFFNVNDNLYITTDPLAFDASGDRVQRDSFHYNRVSPTLSYELGSGGIKMSARFDRVDIDYKTLIDSYQNGYGGSIAGKLGARSTVTADYFEYHRVFERQVPAFNVADYDGRRYGVRLDRRISPRLSANAFVGYEERKFKNRTLEDFDSVIMDAQLSGEFPDVFSWTIAASQRLNDLAIRGAYKVRRANMDLRKSFNDRLRMEFSGFVQNSKNRQIPETADYYGFKLEGQYMVAKFLNIWLGYDYLNRKSVDISPFTENRLNFGLTLSYGL